VSPSSPVRENGIRYPPRSVALPSNE
jgi:hypothetical protein